MKVTGDLPAEVAGVDAPPEAEGGSASQDREGTEVKWNMKKITWRHHKATMVVVAEEGAAAVRARVQSECGWTVEDEEVRTSTHTSRRTTTGIMTDLITTHPRPITILLEGVGEGADAGVLEEEAEAGSPPLAKIPVVLLVARLLPLLKELANSKEATARSLGVI